MNFFSKCKRKYKFYKKIKIIMTNIIYQNKKINIYGNRVSINILTA